MRCARVKGQVVLYPQSQGDIWSKELKSILVAEPCPLHLTLCSAQSGKAACDELGSDVTSSSIRKGKEKPSSDGWNLERCNPCSSDNIQLCLF